MAFPTAKTNAVDNTTEILAAHINNLEDKVGIDGSADADSLDYKVSNVSGGHDHDGVDSKTLGNAYAFVAGMSMLWRGTIANIPAKWAFENGAAISRATYATLFANIGTIHGTGDGSTTFNLPDSRDKFIVGAKQDDSGIPKSNVTGSLLQTGGSLSHSHTGGAHTHTVSDQAAATTDSQGAHTHTFSATTSTQTANQQVGSSNDENSVTDHNHTVSGTTGSNGAHTHTVPLHNHGGATGSGGAVATTSTDTTPPWIASIIIIYTGV